MDRGILLIIAEPMQCFNQFSDFLRPLLPALLFTVTELRNEKHRSIVVDEQTDCVYNSCLNAS